MTKVSEGGQTAQAAQAAGAPEELIQRIEEMLAIWDRDGGETYRDLAVRIVEETAKVIASDFSKNGSH